MKAKKLLPLLFISTLVMTGCGPKYTPPSYTDEDYGYWMELGEIKGVAGDFELNKDYLSIKNGELERKYYPTDIQKESITYEVTRYDEQSESYKTNQTDEILSIYYGSQRNDADYKLTFTPTELKRVVFQKKENDKYVDLYYFTPVDSEFAGSYNGYDEFDLSPYNNVFVVGDELQVDAQEKYLGYQTDVYSEASMAFQRSSNMLVTGFYLLNAERNEYITVADFLDQEDGEFFEYIFYPHENGNLYEIIGDIWYPSFYADPSAFLTDIYDEEGNLHKNSYEVEYDWDTFEIIGITATIDGKEATFSKKRTDSGLKFTFTFADETKIDVYSKLNGFEYIGADNVRHRYAPAASGYELTYVESNLTSGDFSKDFTYYMDMDPDTWEDIEVYKYNGEDITNLKIVADTDGRVVYKFTADGKDIEVKKLSSVLGTITVNGATEYGYYKEYFDKKFNVGLDNPVENISLEINDFKVSTNGETAVQGELFYDPSLDTVGLKYGDKKIVAGDSETGIYILISDKQTLLFRHDLFVALEGTYTSDGTSTIRYQEGKFYVDGNEATYDLSLVNNGTEIVPVFVVDGKIFMPDFKGTISVYSQSGLLVGTYLSQEAFDSFVGKYSYFNAKGEVENIEFASDGKLYMDTENTEGQLVPVQYNYRFSYDSTNKSFVINALVETVAGTAAVPFNKIPYALALVENNLFYIDSRLFELRGAYGDGSSNTIFFTENMIYVNNSKQTIKSVEKVENVTTIKTAAYTIVATLGNDGSVSLTSTSNSGAVINYTDRDAKLANYRGVEFAANETNKYKLESYFASGNISIKTTLNGAFFSNSFFAGYYDGHLAIKTTSLGPNFNVITRYFYFDNSGNPVAIEA